jgi:hypothetical protein
VRPDIREGAPDFSGQVRITGKRLSSWWMMDGSSPVSDRAGLKIKPADRFAHSRVVVVGQVYEEGALPHASQGNSL